MEAVVSTRSSFENDVIARQSCPALLPLLLLLPLLVLGAQENCSGGRASWRQGSGGAGRSLRAGHKRGRVHCCIATYSLLTAQVCRLLWRSANHSPSTCSPPLLVSSSVLVK